jgi:hypothetical protein
MDYLVRTQGNREAARVTLTQEKEDPRPKDGWSPVSDHLDHGSSSDRDSSLSSCHASKQWKSNPRIWVIQAITPFPGSVILQENS